MPSAVVSLALLDPVSVGSAACKSLYCVRQSPQALASAEAPWEVSGLPLQLVESLRHKLDGTPVELPPINLPQDVPGVPAGADQMGPVERAEAALRLQDRYA
jgi:hypothetical protein